MCPRHSENFGDPRTQLQSCKKMLLKNFEAFTVVLDLNSKQPRVVVMMMLLSARHQTSLTLEVLPKLLKVRHLPSRPRRDLSQNVAQSRIALLHRLR